MGALEAKWQEMTKQLVLAKLTGKAVRLEFRGDPHGSVTFVGESLIDDLDFYKQYWDSHPLSEINLYEDNSWQEQDTVAIS